MRTELPVCKRCCFCLPLRYGLITWGYCKLIATIIVSIALFGTLCHIVKMMKLYSSPYHVGRIVVISIVEVMLMSDMVLNTLFIVGGYTKNLRLLRVYYFYNVVLLGLTIALVLVFLILPVNTDSITSYHAWLQLINFSMSFLSIIMQSYFLLLLRSEIIKLRNNCKFRFVNNAAEAKCVMKYEEGMVDEEKETEAVCEKGACETKDVCGKTCHKNKDQN